MHPVIIYENTDDVFVLCYFSKEKLIQTLNYFYKLKKNIYID